MKTIAVLTAAKFGFDRYCQAHQEMHAGDRLVQVSYPKDADGIEFDDFVHAWPFLPHDILRDIKLNIKEK